MSDIFQEVDEALQKEKIEKIWHDHKDKIVIAIAQGRDSVVDEVTTGER